MAVEWTLWSGDSAGRWMSSETRIPLRKIDLHIHTPQSICFSDKSVTAKQIVGAAGDAGLDAIGITDHNTVAAVDDIRLAAEGTDLAVFPGVELSTAGGHMLALFDVTADTAELRHFLVDIGLDVGKWGDPVHLAAGETVDVLSQIAKLGGLAIAAHIERWPSGFLKRDQPRRTRMNIHASDHLDALEITIPLDRRNWNEGTVRGYPKKYACVQGSDAHALDELGRRPVFVRCERLTLAHLRNAFANHRTMLAFPEDVSVKE